MFAHIFRHSLWCYIKGKEATLVTYLQKPVTPAQWRNHSSVSTPLWQQVYLFCKSLVALWRRFLFNNIQVFWRWSGYGEPTRVVMPVYNDVARCTSRSKIFLHSSCSTLRCCAYRQYVEVCPSSTLGTSVAMVRDYMIAFGRILR